MPPSLTGDKIQYPPSARYDMTTREKGLQSRMVLLNVMKNFIWNKAFNKNEKGPS